MNKMIAEERKERKMLTYKSLLQEHNQRIPVKVLENKTKQNKTKQNKQKNPASVDNNYDYK